MNYSPDQSIAIEEITQWFTDHDDTSRARVLTGSAGTGKTTIVKAILDKLTAAGFHPISTAMTHRAATVLEEITGYSTITTHKCFGLVPSIDKYGNETFSTTGKSDLFSGDIIIVDECSMVSDTLLKKLAELAKIYESKILFVGDPFQLMPIKGKCSVFDGSLQTNTLTTVYRQAGDNPVLDKAIEYREYIQGTRSEFPTITTDILNSAGDGIHTLKGAEFDSKFLSKYINHAPHDPVDVPMCTYTNTQALAYNHKLRKAIYFLEGVVEPFYPGERLLSNSSVRIQNKGILNNNEVVFVQAYKAGTYEGIAGHYVVVERTQHTAKQPHIEAVFVPSNESEVKAALSRLRKEAQVQQQRVNGLRRKGFNIPGSDENKRKDLWNSFYGLKNAMADLRSPFAGTTHKAQGGTFHSVFIDLPDINSCRNPATKARLMYVALTRAQHNVFVKVE